MAFRRTILAVHRDLGYLFAALTIVYAVSGIAVNHFEHWNPNYRIEVVSHQLDGLPAGSKNEIAAAVLRRLRIDETPETVARIGPQLFKIFLDGRSLTVFLDDGRVLDERVQERAGFYEVNFLHLNYGKGFWTWFADVYALGLLTMAITGIFIIPVRGKKGLGRRGAWFMAAGVLLPLAYLIIARW